MRVSEIFERMPRLNTLDCNHSYFYNFHAKTTQPPSFAMRRKFYLEGGKQYQALKIWQLEWAHEVWRLHSWKIAEPHPKWTGFHHIELEGEGYKGKEGDDWKMSKAEIRSTRSCTRNGIGGCDKYLTWKPGCKEKDY